MAHATDIEPTQIGGNCRFYEKEFPDLEECVVVNVKSIAEMGAYVQVRRMWAVVDVVGDGGGRSGTHTARRDVTRRPRRVVRGWRHVPAVAAGVARRARAVRARTCLVPPLAAHSPACWGARPLLATTSNASSAARRPAAPPARPPRSCWSTTTLRA
jgi:hypothetical protein